MNRYNFNFNLVDADEVLAEMGLGKTEAQITVAVNATNERRAVIIASALIRHLNAERWTSHFEEAMNSGNYETERVAE